MVKYANKVETKGKEILPEIKNKLSDRIYVNMASVSVYRSSAKYVLGTKTLTLPTQDTGWCLHLPLSSAIIMIITLSRGLIQLARPK